MGSKVYVSWVQEVSFHQSTNFGDPPLSVAFSFESAFGSGYTASWTWGDGNTSLQSLPNGTATGATESYQWWNYTHKFVYIGSFIPQITISKDGHDATGSSNVYMSFVPSLFYSYYNESGLISRGDEGATYSIGLAEECSVPPGYLGNFTSDLTTFDSEFRLPTATVLFEGPGNRSCPSPNPNFVGETDLDIEWAHVAAPDATIYVCLSNVGGSLQSQYAGLESCDQEFYQYRGATSWNTRIVSNSWGFCGWGNGTTSQGGVDSLCYNGGDPYYGNWSAYAQAGMTVLASVGDIWPGPCVLSMYPAADPYLLAVGATTIDQVGPGGSYGSESQWFYHVAVSGVDLNPQCYWKADGQDKWYYGETYGRYVNYSAPSWQVPLFGNGTRWFPDISMVGNESTGVPVFSDGKWLLVGGTSVGSPIWAGLLDILFQAGTPGLSGFAASFLYGHSACFNSVSVVQSERYAGDRDGLGTPNVGCLSTA
ncbi:MAG TPA: hypothetical protein VMG81_00015 [Thermoplasmata archaeon]|nr:hypothetical protein [Thermoplasmata archaeon]